MTKMAEIIEQFNASIIGLDELNPSKINCLNEKIRRTQDCLNELRKDVKLNGFDSPKEEIYFFKKQKPYIKGRLKFYVSLNKYYYEKPIGSKSKIRKYINLQLSLIRNENCKNNHFINYYKLEHTNKDNIYFLRGAAQFEVFIDNTTIYEDPEFCTLRGHLASKIVANDLLSQFYTKELEACKKKSEKQGISEVQKKQIPYLTWTASKTELVECLLGLNSVGAIGGGQLTIKQLQEISRDVFNVDIVNFYKIVEQIKARKGDKTRFLTKLAKKLQSIINSQILNL